VRQAENEERLNKADRRTGEWLRAIGQGRGRAGLEGAELVDIRFKLPREEDPMVLMVVRARVGVEKYVAFVGAGSVGQALLAWRKLDEGKGLKWRVDVPWDGQ